MTKDTLYPPLETRIESSEHPNMLLSFELKRSFETVHHIQSQMGQMASNDISDNVKVQTDGSTPKKDQQDLEARKFEAAVAAAVAAESEISTLKRGIMELENLLCHESSSTNVTKKAGTDKFPILPFAVEDETFQND